MSVSPPRGLARRPSGVRPGRPSAQRGLGLIEVLVALVVVSLGVLGMAGLQLTGMKHSTGGFNRSKALLVAENMATRMRINGAGVAAGAYDGFDSATLAGSCAAKPVPYCQASVATGGNVVAAQSCTTGQLAAFDRWSIACGDWGVGTQGGGEGVTSSLPEGRLRIGCDVPGACATYTVTVQWREGSVASDKADASDTKRVQLRLRP